MVFQGIPYGAENALTDDVEDVSGAAMVLPNDLVPYWSLEGRVGEDTFEMYLRYRYMRGCIFCIFR